MKYLLDSNTYIQAKNFYYGMDICPAYWDWLDRQFQLGRVASIQMIGKELKDGNDELAEWVKARPEHFIDNDDTETQVVFSEIVQSVVNGDYNAGRRCTSSVDRLRCSFRPFSDLFPGCPGIRYCRCLVLGTPFHGILANHT